MGIWDREEQDTSSGVSRRGFIRLVGLGTAAACFAERPVFAGPFEKEELSVLVPRDKKLRPEWIRSLYKRGAPEWYRGRELDFVGMPVGGVACGQLYLGGDGKLWYWDIFKSATATDGANAVWAGPHYANPLKPDSAVEHGAVIRIRDGERVTMHTLDRQGFPDAAFRGEYPVGRVAYKDAALPVEVQLEAFSPFIPLHVADSTLPATTLSYTVKNIGAAPLEVDVAYRLENAVCRYGDGGLDLTRTNSFEQNPKRATIRSTVKQTVHKSEARPSVLFEDFESGYGKWTVEGEAFGAGPATGTLPGQQEVSGFAGKGLVNSFLRGDDTTGKMTSAPFLIQRRFISFLIGGGGGPDVGMNLIVDNKVVRSATGRNVEQLTSASWNVRDLEGQQARIEIFDNAKGGWGHINVDQILFTDEPTVKSLEDVPGYGTLAISVLEGPGKTFAATDIGNDFSSEGLFAALDRNRTVPATDDTTVKLVGAVGKRIELKPGESKTVSFILSWWFPYYGPVGGEMSAIADMAKLKRNYVTRFKSASEVADYTARNFDRLTSDTRLWNKTWYDSTLPHWLLDRTFIPIDTIATQTLHHFDNGRWWGWEGVDCCAGTCQHVWQYAQSIARIFPEIERDLRERVDFGLAWHNTGAMDFRSENDRSVAHDGFCGTLLRVYREHRMSPDRAFLTRLWPRIRQSLTFIMGQDRDADGLLEGVQMNTLDTAWYGPMAWISSLYLGAVAAGEQMATEMGDAEFASKCRQRLAAGQKSIVEKLFNGEYFIHKPPDFKHTNSNVGCHSDQMLGQSMAFPLGLPRIVAEPQAKSALKALWTYNFTPDVGPYRQKFKTIDGGRWYAMAGEGGMIVCTWPRGGEDKAGGEQKAFVYYFNECWTGFEYSVASHMIWEGMVEEGLAVTRAVHDRYHPSKRNPYNEIECSDHYSRAMSSYGVFLAACGFEYHGPNGHIGFAPRLTPHDFRAPFTTAAGWGTYSQKRSGRTQRHTLDMKWGSLTLRSLAFAVDEKRPPTRVTVSAQGKTTAANLTVKGARAEIRLADEISIGTGQKVTVTLS